MLGIPNAIAHIHIPAAVAAQLVTDLVNGQYGKAVEDAVPVLCRALANHAESPKMARRNPPPAPETPVQPPATPPDAPPPSVPHPFGAPSPAMPPNTLFPAFHDGRVPDEPEGPAWKEQPDASPARRPGDTLRGTEALG